MLRAMSVKHGPRDAAAFLRTNTVFGSLPAREIELLGSAAVEETHRPREFLFLEGDPAKWFCVVKSGHVKILRQSRTGKDVLLELLGPGEVFGGIAVIEQRPYPAAAQATGAVVVLKIPAEAMIAVSERHPSFVKELALMIGRRLRAAHDSVKSLAIDPVESRLAAALLRLAEREGTRDAHGITIPFHLTRQNLADMSGTTVETAIRVVSRWLRDGLVRDEEGRLGLTDLDALRALAEGEGR
jgi:CRP/FNR family transcriptional regulator, nitrogen oxide reductase regulator